MLLAPSAASFLSGRGRRKRLAVVCDRGQSLFIQQGGLGGWGEEVKPQREAEADNKDAASFHHHPNN
jgi:hypothetical protein